MISENHRWNFPYRGWQCCKLPLDAGNGSWVLCNSSELLSVHSAVLSAPLHTLLLSATLLDARENIVFSYLYTFHLKLFLFLFYALCALVFSLYVCLCTGAGSSGIRVIDSFELTCGYWELNPGLLEEQSVFIISEPSL